MLCLFLLIFDFFDSCLIFVFFLQGKIIKFVRRCFGRLDGSIRALRKVRFRNETRKVFPNPGGRRRRRRRRRRRKNFPRASKPQYLFCGIWKTWVLKSMGFRLGTHCPSTSFLNFFMVISNWHQRIVLLNAPIPRISPMQKNEYHSYLTTGFEQSITTIFVWP